MNTREVSQQSEASHYERWHNKLVYLSWMTHGRSLGKRSLVNIGDDLSVGCKVYIQILLLTLVLIGFCSTAANAQVATFAQTNVGTATGSYAYSSGSGGTYTVVGSGTGVSGTSDNFSYASTPTTGNIEMVAKVTSLTGTGLSNYAEAGLMVREDTLTANGPTALISISPENGVNFTARTASGVMAITTLGPSIAPPTYLRLVVSGTSVAGYSSSDNGLTWVLVGKTTISLPSAYYAGFAVASNISGTPCTAVFNNLSFMTAVPQRSSNLQLWLRSDVGVQYTNVSGTNQVTQWTDQSGNGNNAFQSTSAAQPTLTAGGTNQAVTFNGTSQYLQLGSGFANFTAGASVFIVTKAPSSLSNQYVLMDFGNNNGTANNELLVTENLSTSTIFGVYSGTSTCSQ